MALSDIERAANALWFEATGWRKPSRKIIANAKRLATLLGEPTDYNVSADPYGRLVFCWLELNVRLTVYIGPSIYTCIWIIGPEENAPMFESEETTCGAVKRIVDSVMNRP